MVVDRLMALALALGVSNLERSKILMRDITALCRTVRELEHHNWIVKRRAWILSCPKRIANVRSQIGEAAIKFWVIRRDDGLLERTSPRPFDYHKPSIPISRTPIKWAQYALPRFMDGVYKPAPNLKKSSARERSDVQNPRTAPPVIFWPKELGADTARPKRMRQPAQRTFPSKHRRDNAERIGGAVSTPIEPEDKPP